MPVVKCEIKHRLGFIVTADTFFPEMKGCVGIIFAKKICVSGNCTSEKRPQLTYTLGIFAFKTAMMYGV